MAKQTKREFMEFLRGTLIPDLKESGMVETAKDFETCLEYMGRQKVAKRPSTDGFIDTDAVLECLLLGQIDNDKKTGTVGVEEAGYKGHYFVDHLSDLISIEDQLSEEDQLMLVAIAEIGNALDERVLEIYKRNNL